MSALNRPRTVAYYENADLIRQAACLGMGVARAHAFVDGNKRTAQQCLLVFLSINGCKIIGGKEANLALAKLLEELLEPEISDADADGRLEDWLRDHTHHC